MKTWLNIKVEGGQVTATAYAATEYESAVTGGKGTVHTSMDVPVPEAMAVSYAALLESVTPELEKKARRDVATHIVHEPAAKKSLLRMAAEAVGLASKE